MTSPPPARQGIGPPGLTSLLGGDDGGLQRLPPALPGLGRQPEDVRGLRGQLGGRELPHSGADLHGGERVRAAAGQAVGDLVNPLTVPTVARQRLSETMLCVPPKWETSHWSLCGCNGVEWSL